MRNRTRDVICCLASRKGKKREQTTTLNRLLNEQLSIIFSLFWHKSKLVINKPSETNNKTLGVTYSLNNN